ncbi:MAG TPA: type II toxin-antitoxin system VapC family toxin [Phototrophicaceae bacterium]|nr:type II toxin-antitoxin system VapC family toxin [Phototrophicaceae bacterium]
MTSWVVVDSGLYLAVALNETHAATTKAFLNAITLAQTRIGAPFLFRYEIISVIRKHIYRGSITLEDGRVLAQGLLRAPVEIFTAEVLLPRAFELANQFNRPTAYDSVYLALAERLECEFWTADLKLFNAVSARLTWVKWIGNYMPSQSS